MSQVTPDSTPASLLFDTNVWVDQYLAQRPGHEDSISLLRLAIGLDITPLYAIHSSSTVFYLISAGFKQQMRMDKGGELAQEDATVASAFAWACLENMAEIGCAVGADASDIWLARKQRPLHADYEDDLVIAAALRSKAMLITNDGQLIRHCPVAAMDVHDAIAYLKSLKSAG